MIEFDNQVKSYIDLIEKDHNFSVKEYVSIGFLWNTICYYNELLETENGKKFYEIIRDKLFPEMIENLEMQVSRGYSFYSKKFDFMLGGIMEERYRYQLTNNNSGIREEKR